jgi:hypothetical protein
MGIHYGTNAYPQDNTELMSIKAGGNVGIGTTNPAEKLEIVGPDASAATIRWRNSGGRKSGYLYSDSVGVGIYDTNINNAGIYLAENAQIDFRVNGSIRMLISGSGNVGIGTTSPSSTFHVRGLFGAPSGSGSSQNGIARLGQTSGNGALDIGFGDPYSWLQSRNITDYSTNYNLSLQPNGGNVGIGTIAPSAKFNVNNNGGTGDTFYVDAGNAPGNQVLFEHSGANTPVPFTIRKSGYVGSSNNFGVLYIDMAHNVADGGSNLYFTLRDSNGGVQEYGGLGAVITTNTAGNMAGALNFYTTNAGTTRQIRMHITSGGIVGINNTSPLNTAWGNDSVTKQLSINGSSYAVINLRGNARTYSSGVGDDRFYMAYDNTEAKHRLTIDSSGNVSMRDSTSPAYRLDVGGDIRATGDVIAYSDARVKDNVETIKDALQTIISLRGVTYTRNDSEDKSRKVGVIAQEVLPILPEVVQQDIEGKYNVAYGNIVGVLIEAIKEQQQQIDELKYLLQTINK